MLEELGFRFERQAKGDHAIYVRGAEKETIDGSPNHELPYGLWQKLRKRYGLKG